MSYQEYLCRCETKHCYHCGGPLVAGYKCPKKNLRFLILAEDEWINNEGEITRLEGELEKPKMIMYYGYYICTIVTSLYC